MRSRRSTRRFGVAAIVATLATVFLLRPAARADDATFVVPPAPERGPSWWELEITGAAVVPLERSAICPAAHDCVMNAGVGVGARLLHRQPDRVGLSVAYDLWVLDSASLYEVALVHAVRVGVRYVLDDSTRVQPWLAAQAGALLFGSASTVATGGGLVSLGGGAHFELSEDVALAASADVWLLATAPFQTRDGALRADPFGVNVVLQVTLGAMFRFGTLE